MKHESKAQRKERVKREKNRKLKWMLVTGCILLIAAITGFYLSNRPQPKAVLEVEGAPSLKVDQENIDMGDIKLGRTVNASFLLTNVGDESLQITKAPYIEVKQGC